MGISPMFNLKKEKVMNIDKKPSDLSTQLFDMTKSFSNMSRIGNLYGRLTMIKDMQIYLAKEEGEVKKQIDENDISK